jgi:hypothetical protein
MDVALTKLKEDKSFVSALKAICQKNNLRYEDVQTCIDGLYHQTANIVHEHNHDNVIDDRDWMGNEVLALVVIFRHFGVPFRYRNARGEEVSSPYDVIIFDCYIYAIDLGEIFFFFFEYPYYSCLCPITILS